MELGWTRSVEIESYVNDTKYFILKYFWSAVDKTSFSERTLSLGWTNVCAMLN